MARHAHAAPGLEETAVRTEQKCRADYADVRLAVELLLADYVERAAPGFVGVGDERKRQLVLVAELHVRGLAVARHADDCAVLFTEFRVEIAERLRLERAARRRVLRVEVDDERLADVIGELDRRAVLRRAFELGCLVAGFEHVCGMPRLLRHSRESGIHVPWRPEKWMPACAGMTGVGMGELRTSSDP